MERDVIRLIALDGSKVIGWCQIKSGSWEGYTHMSWLQMGVHKDYRGQGIGTAPLSQALEKARRRGLERVELDVYASNLTAIHLSKNTNSRSRVGRREPGNLMECMTILLTWHFYSMCELLCAIYSVAFFILR
jgi:GNAT superfamily N-acetyltransferase